MPRRMQNGVILLAAIMALILAAGYFLRPMPRESKRPDIPYGIQQAMQNHAAHESSPNE